MGTQRLILRGGSQPLKILAPGVADPNSANFVSLLFDGNAATLRVWMKGTVNVPLATANVLYSDWTVATAVGISLGKTFPTPPLATSVMFFNGDRYRLPAMAQSQTNLSSGPSYSTFGGGVATSTNALYCWNANRTQIGGSNPISYVVFDHPIGI